MPDSQNSPRSNPALDRGSPVAPDLRFLMANVESRVLREPLQKPTTPILLIPHPNPQTGR